MDAQINPSFPPGWYDDPWRVSKLRWWDGSAWTNALQPAPTGPPPPPTNQGYAMSQQFYQAPVATVPHDVSRVTAGVLALLLGGLGIHKFYCKKTGLGILYLVFCWTFIPAIIALVEGIIYFVQDDAKFARAQGLMYVPPVSF